MTSRFPSWPLPQRSDRSALVLVTCASVSASATGGRRHRGSRAEQDQPARREPDARADHHAVVAGLGQAALHGWRCGLVGIDEAVLPAALGHVSERNLDPCVDLLRAHARRQRRIRKVHRRRIQADQQNPLHLTSPVKLGRHPAERAVTINRGTGDPSPAPGRRE